MKRTINFTQYETVDNTVLAGLSFEIHRSLIEIGREVEYSPNGKILPFFEGNVEFQVTLEDGTVTTLSGSLALWYNKKHVKEAIKAAEQAKKEAEKRAKEEEIKKARAELLKTFTDEQIQALTALGLLKLEEE